ncbi:hypothetical protein [Achromobacter insolitus]|uniref:hypothetical protein n=1 Tax=Achromobacter insolitus TaxID=217204 RepID=UPI000A6ACA66|nr:hypothetical protein [Achromobacter insolitus]AVG38373.1 hypothetical protein MC81_02710 [Achromobacter insolitus]
MNNNDDVADKYLTEAFIKSLHARVTQMEQNMQTYADATTKNTECIEQIRRNTQDIVDTFQALAGGFKVLQGLGRLAKPLAYIVGLVTAVITAYSAWRGIR